MKSSKKETKKVTGKDAIGEDKKAFKEVFLEETTRIRVKFGIIETKLKELSNEISKINSRLGL
tara:strand:- start:1440 stop:1628 length:189 start_codon:yes stop_codon:yes gene_type:complete